LFIVPNAFFVGGGIPAEIVQTVNKHLEQSERTRSVSGVFVFTATANQGGTWQEKVT
jgi:hypothetical protein